MLVEKTNNCSCHASRIKLKAEEEGDYRCCPQCPSGCVAGEHRGTPYDRIIEMFGKRDKKMK